MNTIIKNGMAINCNGINASAFLCGMPDNFSRESLQHEIKSLQKELVEKRHKLAIFETLKQHATLPPDAVKNFIKAFPWAVIQADRGEIALRAERMPVLFHTARGANPGGKNNDIIYATLPNYDYRLNFHASGRLTGRCEGNTLHHPHVNNSGREFLGSTCHGTNDFKSDFIRFSGGNGANAAEMLTVLTKACIWLESANLSDMYDPGNLIDTDRGIVIQIDELANGFDLGKPLPFEIRDTELHARALYALWHLKNFNKLRRVTGSRVCLKSALYSDLDSIQKICAESPYYPVRPINLMPVANCIRELAGYKNFDESEHPHLLEKIAEQSGIKLEENDE